MLHCDGEGEAGVPELQFTLKDQVPPSCRQDLPATCQVHLGTRLAPGMGTPSFSPPQSLHWADSRVSLSPPVQAHLCREPSSTSPAGRRVPRPFRSARGSRSTEGPAVKDKAHEVLAVCSPIPSSQPRSPPCLLSSDPQCPPQFSPSPLHTPGTDQSLLLRVRILFLPQNYRQ